MVQRGGVDVDSFGDFGAEPADELGAEQFPLGASPVTLMVTGCAVG